MVAFIQIPKTTSSPADPGTASFLTTLPPEIRNAIYEVMFKHEKPILLHNAKAYHARPPETELYSDPTVNAQVLQRFDAIYETELVHGEPFAHGLHLSVPLLLTCRQIYAECIGVFYGGNIFAFSRALHRHDITDEDSAEHDIENYETLAYLPCWLSSIGSNFQLLTKVIIDVDAMCFKQCEHAFENYSILDLARCLWVCPRLNNVISFATLGRSSTEHRDYFPASHVSNQASIRRANLLNMVFDSLVVRDALNLKRYARSSQLLSDILLDGDLTFGWTYYPYASPHHEMRFRSFHVSEDGIIAWSQQAGAVATFSHLHDDVRQRIRELAVFSAPSLTFDLDTCTIHGLNPNGSLLRLENDSIWPRVPSDIHVSFITSSKLLTTSLESFSFLKDLITPPLGTRWLHTRSLRSLVLGGLADHPSTTILINFDVDIFATLEQVRINIKNMHYLLGDCRFPRNATIHFTLKCSHSRGKHEEEASVTVTDLQMQLFLLLSDYAEQRQIDSQSEWSDDLPDVWMNGRGVLLEASSLTTDTPPACVVKYRHGSLTKQDLKFRGYRMATKAKEYFLALDIEEEDDWTDQIENLLEIWCNLRKMHWENYKHRRTKF
jgi:hypothetical protein